MSVQAIAWALTVKTGTPSAKVVLLTIANYADAAGKCWPSQALIAAQSEQSVDSVQRRILELEFSGYLKRQNRRRASTIYQLLMPELKKPQSAVSRPETQILETAKSVLETATVRYEPLSRTTNSKIKKDKGGNGLKNGKQAPPHGSTSKNGSLKIFIHEGTSEWSDYASDYRDATGKDPYLLYGCGHWFDIVGKQK